MKTIALIDDDKSIREVLGAYLTKMGYQCTVYEHPLLFTQDLRQGKHFDFAITDVNMPRVTGLELVAWLKRYYPCLCTIALTAYGNRDIESVAYQGGACLFLQKPVKLDQLHRVLRLLSQEGLSGEVFHVSLVDCLQTLACDANPRILKIQENGTSHFMVALQNNMLQGLSYMPNGGPQLLGEAAFARLTAIGDATFSEVTNEQSNLLLAQNLNIPLPQMALHIVQYQDEQQQQPIKAQTLGIWGPEAPKKLLTQILNNMGFEVSDQIEACQAHLIMNTTPDNFSKILPYQNPILIADKYLPLFSKQLGETPPSFVRAVSLSGVSEWAAYVKAHFIRGLSGTLSKVSVFQLIQLVSQAGTTGCIKLKDLIKQKENVLYFVQGKLVEAISQGNESLVGESALFDSMRIRMGFFQQTFFEEPPSRQLESYSVTRLLMNFSRPFELEEAFSHKIDGLLSSPQV